MTRLLTAVDSSGAADPVCAVASIVAPVFGATIDCVHVREDGGDDVPRATCAAAGLHLRTVGGEPRDGLLAIVGEDDVVALVLGARDPASGSARVGHLPFALAAATDKPVIVVPPAAAPPPRLRRVLVAMKGTPRHAIELRRAVELADAQDLEIVVVHVDDVSTIPAFSDQVQHETEAYTKEFFARYLPGASHARLECRIGDVAGEILEVAEASRSEVLAIGWPHTAEPPAGAVGRTLLERSAVPVLLVGTVA